MPACRDRRILAVLRERDAEARGEIPVRAGTEPAVSAVVEAAV